MPEEIEKPALSKREFFALEAMKVLVGVGGKETYLGNIATYSVRMADQLIRELEKEPKRNETW